MGSEDVLSGLKVLSVEHMIALPYCTWRLAAEGAEVIKVEPRWGDPIRFAGKKILDEEGMNAYFLNANTMKKSVTLDLTRDKGREILARLVEEWQPDVFATNMISKSYCKLHVDFEKIRALKEDIIWLGITGFGPDRSEAAYDPTIQMYSGIADTNGEPGSPPLKLGISITDLETANQAYTEILRALVHRERTGEGSRIDVSMLQVSMSLLALHIPIAGLGIPIPKKGNSHPQFAPVGLYPTGDGHVMIAIGKEEQYNALASLPGFERLQKSGWDTMESRSRESDAVNSTVGEILQGMTTSEAVELLKGARIPVSQATTLEGIFKDPYLLGHLIPIRDEEAGIETYNAPLPVGKPKRVPIPLPPRMGEHNEEIYGSLCLDMNDLREKKII
jgi:formyl-CoA transferase